MAWGSYGYDTHLPDPILPAALANQRMVLPSNESYSCLIFHPSFLQLAALWLWWLFSSASILLHVSFQSDLPTAGEHPLVLLELCV